MSEENKKTINIIDVLRNENENVIEDYYELCKEIYDDFDNQAYAKKHGYSCPSFPIFNEKLEGLEEGLYIFAGESNSGKTALMTNLMWAFCKHKPNKLFGIYYSLDDNTNEVIPRLIAMDQRIPISVCSKPSRYEDYITENKNSQDPDIVNTCTRYNEFLKKREEGLNNLRSANKEFIIFDRTRITCFEQMLDHAKKIQTYVKSFDPENNIMIAIDSLADLNVSEKKFTTDRERIDHVVMKTKEAANIHLRVPIFTSYHVRKLNHQGRPTLDDMKESSRIVYEASVAFLVFNDVSKNKQAANVYYTEENVDEKKPVIEIDWAKNKKSSYKGRTYHYFVPNFSHVKEMNHGLMDRYDSIIYTK